MIYCYIWIRSLYQFRRRYFHFSIIQEFFFIQIISNEINLHLHNLYADISFYSFFSRVQTQEEDTGRTGEPDESPGVSSTFNYDIESGGSVGLVLWYQQADSNSCLSTRLASVKLGTN